MRKRVVHISMETFEGMLKRMGWMDKESHVDSVQMQHDSDSLSVVCSSNKYDNVSIYCALPSDAVVR